MQINISTRLLRAFLALNECRHFTHAAERCHVSQSAFSVMIQKLETAVGARLFERDTRNVTLTPEGELFDALSDHCLELLRQGKADLALTAPGANLIEFDTSTLCSDPFYLICRRDH